MSYSSFADSFFHGTPSDRLSARKGEEKLIENCYTPHVKKQLGKIPGGGIMFTNFHSARRKDEVKKKVLAALLTAAMAVSMLAGCGGNQGSEETAQTSGSGEKTDGGTFIVPVNADTTDCITPYDAYGADDKLMTYAPCYDPLFIVNKDETRWYLADSTAVGRPLHPGSTPFDPPM